MPGAGRVRSRQLTRQQVPCGEDLFATPSRAPSSWRQMPLRDSRTAETEDKLGGRVGPGLVSFVNNEPFISKIRANTQLKNWDQDRIRQFTGNEILRTDTQTRRSWTSLIIKEMLIKIGSYWWFTLIKDLKRLLSSGLLGRGQTG